MGQNVSYSTMAVEPGIGAHVQVTGKWNQSKHCKYALINTSSLEEIILLDSRYTTA